MPRGDDVDDGTGRRNVLRTLGAGAVGLSLSTGSVVADRGEGDENGNGDDPPGKAKRGKPERKKMRIDPSTPGMTDREREDFVRRMTKRYGESAAATIRPDPAVSADGQQPGVTPGSILWDNSEYLSVSNGYGDKLAEADYYTALYDTDVIKEGTDQEYFFYWLWSSAGSIDQGYVEGNLKNFWSYVGLNGSGDTTTYDPGSDTSGGGIPVTVSASVSGEDPSGSVGASAGLEAEFTLAQNTVGPKRSKTSTTSDEFAVQWDGDFEGNQEINGTMVERRSQYEGYDFSWEISLDASGV